MIRAKFWSVFPIIFFIFLGIAIYLTNLSGNFWLSGWDNLHPEFDFILNLKRALFSSWQEYQGLGLPAGHGHAGEFFREIILAVFSFLAPLQSLRKIYTVLMFIAGPLGIYFLLKKFFLKDDTRINNIASYLGGTFYALHIATVQIFYLPYEAFITHYGLMPWMVFSIYHYVHRPVRKNLVLLILIHLIGAAQFYIPTLVLVYGSILALIGLDLSKKTGWQTIVKTYLIILAANLFWLLPFLYYSFTNLGSQINAYLNLLYSTDIYLKNFAYGGFLDTLLLKGFLFSFTDQVSPQSYGYLMATWRNYFSQPAIIVMALILSLIFIAGIIISVKKKVHTSFVFLFLIFFSLIAIDAIPFNFLNAFLRKIPFFDQVFRNPYTKFSNALLFAESILFALGIRSILDFFKNRKISYLIAAAIVFMQVAVVFPIWQGNFIYPNLKVKIPSEYFDLFNYFQGQPDGRIANFPQSSPNGWQIYDWGYRGSGFLWYGIRQSILDRAFDVWDKNGENYFWEINRATYSNDPIMTINVFKKYHVRWILVDNNVVGLTSNQAIDRNKFKNLIGQIPEAFLVRSFGDIDLYELHPEEGYVAIAEDLPNVSPVYKWGDYDAAFKELGPYMSGGDIFYPFRSLFTGRGKNEDGLNISETDESFIFTATVPSSFADGRLIVPEIDQEQITEYDKIDLLKITEKNPSVYFDKATGIFTLVVPKIYGYNSFDTGIENDYLDLPLKSCDEFQTGQFNKKINQQNNLELYSLASSNCFDIQAPLLTHKNGYILTINSQNIQGRGLLFSLLDQTSSSVDLQTYLNPEKEMTAEYFIIPPKDQYGLGYNLHFDNYSLGNNPVSNILGGVRINQIPYDLLTSIKIVKKESGQLLSSGRQIQVDGKHVNYANYSVDLQGYTVGDRSTLILYQSFNPGWIAISNGQLLDHVLVNNWANGWRLFPDNNKVTIIFWPQYLEFIGLGILLSVIVIIVFYEIINRHRRTP